MSSHSGARIEKISDLLSLPRVTSTNDLLFASVGTNNILKESSSTLSKKFNNLINILKDRRTKPVLCCILPRKNCPPNWNSSARSWNDCLKVRCHQPGISFLKLWDTFDKDDKLYSRDGVHLSPKGKNRLADAIEDFSIKFSRNFLVQN